MNLSAICTQRRTTKAFDATRTIAPELVSQLLTCLQFAPSSVNAQPWHFHVAATPEGKALLARGAEGKFAYNAPKILNASHVVALCARTSLPAEHLDRVLSQETQDGRFPTPEARAGVAASRLGYVQLHRDERQDLTQWTTHQVYLALGTLLLGAAGLGVDACPMEGINTAAIDEALNLTAQGQTCVALCALGYRSSEDFNAALPKSRLDREQVITLF